MKKNRFAVISIILVLSVILTGCFDVNRDFKRLSRDVCDAMNCRLKKDTEFGAGSGLIGLAQTFISFSDDTDAEEANEILDEINSVQVGIYKNRSRDFDPDYNQLQEIEELLKDNNWESLIRKNGNDEFTLIMVLPEDESYEKMLVVEFDHRELIICEISGDLEKIIEKIQENEELCIEINN